MYKIVDIFKLWKKTTYWCHQQVSVLALLTTSDNIVEHFLYASFHYNVFFALMAVKCHTWRITQKMHLLSFKKRCKFKETGIFCLRIDLVSIIQTYRPWTPQRTSGRIVNKKIWHESEAYRNFGKRFDWSLAIKRHIVMAAPIVETIWLVNSPGQLALNAIL